MTKVPETQKRRPRVKILIPRRVLFASSPPTEKLDINTNRPKKNINLPSGVIAFHTQDIGLDCEMTTRLVFNLNNLTAKVANTTLIT